MMRIPFGSLPAMSALFLDYVDGSERVRPFYPQQYSIEAIAAFARQRPALDVRHREQLCSALAGDATSIKKLAAGAVAVITGQQPGLFTGPMYTILKALTIVKLAKALEDGGVAAVPVFWIAAEDHDYQEIESAFVLDRDYGLKHVRVDLSNPDSSPVAWLKFSDDISEAMSSCLSSLPESEFQPEVQEILQSAYRPGASPVEAFARMLSRLSEGTGLIFANPLHEELRKLAQPMLQQAERENAKI